MKLISMTDFVLENFNANLYGGFNEQLKQMAIKMNQIRVYAEFLKQPLELGMFVPVDENGVVFEEPHNFGLLHTYPTGNKLMDQSFESALKYQKAKERVLFDGFEFTESQKFSVENGIKNSVHWYTKERLYLTTKKNNGYRTYFQLFTIEDLIQCDLQLTESAIKQLGL